MKIPIFYFSSSNNTKYVGELIGKGLTLINHDPQLISWTSLRSNPINIQEYEAFGIGGPIYALSYPPFLISWIKSLPKANNEQSFFLFDTSAGLPGNALNYAKKMLEDKGYSFLGGLEIVSPTRDSVFKLSYFENLSWSREKLDRGFQFGLKIGKLFEKPNLRVIDWTFRRMPFSIFIRKGFQSVEKALFRFLGKSIQYDSAKCTNCMECSRLCPTNAIDIERDPVVDPNLCIGCFKCLRTCPVGALYLKQLPNAEYFEGPQEIEGYISPDTILKEYQQSLQNFKEIE